MKRKMFAVLLLVGVCLSVLVVEGVSQPPSSPTPVPLPPPASPSPTKANFATVEPQQQEWTFEQLVEALKGVRARQKELKAQETDLLAKMAEKIEQKRKDLQKAEEMLQQLQGDPNRPKPIIGEEKKDYKR
jgi:hypothetical protein